MASVSLPACCAVAVVCGKHLISQIYPASVPIEVFIDDIVELLDDELKRRGLAGLTAGVGYELHKVNGVRLDISRTLDELGVEDGATLVLAPATNGDSFEPQYESLSTGLARIGKKLFEPVTAETAAHTALAILAMVAATVLALALRVRARTDSLAPSIVTGAFGVLAAAGLAAVWLRWPHRGDLADGFSGIAVPMLAGGVAGAAPGQLGCAHVFIAALAVALLSWAVSVATQRRIAAASAIVTLCGVTGALAAARMWRPVPAQWLGMGILVALLVVLTAAPTIALWAARIRPPHFGSVTGRDLFRRRDGLPVDTVSPVDAEDEANPDTTPRGKQIAAAAVRANGVLTGICVGAALTLPAGVWVTLMPGQSRSAAAATLAGLFVLIFISRGRAFTDKRQAVALVCGAAAAACAGVAKFVLHEPAASVNPLLWAALALAGFGGVGLAAALLVPITKFTPLVRMLTEWLELAAIAAALPLAAWIGSLFTWVRMR